MHHFLTFSAALGTLSKLNCTRLHENLLWDFRLRPKQLNSKNDCGQFSPRLDKGKNSFPRARNALFSRKTRQLYTNWLNRLFYIWLRVYSLHLKPVISDGFVLSCLVLNLVDYFLVKLTVFLQTSYSALLYEAGFKCHYPQDSFHYQQDNFHYQQDNFPAHIR